MFESSIWDILSAVGTCAGAAATFWAVRVSLKQSALAYKPRISARLELGEARIQGSLVPRLKPNVSAVISATNVGMISCMFELIEINSFGRKPVLISLDRGGIIFMQGFPDEPLAPGATLEMRLYDSSFLRTNNGWLTKCRLFAFPERVLRTATYRMSLVDLSGEKTKVSISKRAKKCIADYEDRCSRYERLSAIVSAKDVDVVLLEYDSGDPDLLNAICELRSSLDDFVNEAEGYFDSSANELDEKSVSVILRSINEARSARDICSHFTSAQNKPFGVTRAQLVQSLACSCAYILSLSGFFGSPVSKASDKTAVWISKLNGTIFYSSLVANLCDGALTRGN